ncbi:unnamed protein product [Rangifer tarandus platyrhynchus]|uniref:Uncharacterized protein n=1 Tax=Rangifer tarandus platyrhynchus TaxID=3082113 RepID=A0AC59YRJ0_RANTA
MKLLYLKSFRGPPRTRQDRNSQFTFSFVGWRKLQVLSTLTKKIVLRCMMSWQMELKHLLLSNRSSFPTWQILQHCFDVSSSSEVSFPVISKFFMQIILSLFSQFTFFTP